MLSLHATHKRLSRNLARGDLETKISQEVLKLGARRIKDDTLLIVAPSDLTKKYAEKMEYLAEVRDGSDKTIGSGYWLCEVIGCEVGSNEITPLAETLWSQEAPDFVSENKEIMSLVNKVRQATAGRGILVYFLTMLGVVNFGLAQGGNFRLSFPDDRPQRVRLKFQQGQWLGWIKC